MAKVCILSIDYGSFEQGFRVGLEIKELKDGHERPLTQVVIPGKLPKMPELPKQYLNWQQKYCSIRSAATRMKVNSINAPKARQTTLECKESLDELKQSFQEWLDSSEFCKVDRELRMQLQLDEEVQFIILTDNDLLRKMPWDSWELVSHYNKAGLAIGPCTYRGTISYTSPNRVKILAVLGNKENINVEKDKEILKRLPGADVTFLDEPKRIDIYQALEKNDWDILFFAGHSSSKEEGKNGELIVNKVEKIRINEIEDILQDSIQRGLKLAIFNSCDGLGVANKLLQMRIPQVIVWREPVPDEVAHRFLKRFLKELSRGHSLHIAMRITKSKIKEIYKYERQYPGSSALPMILQNSSVEPFKWPVIDTSDSYIPESVDDTSKPLLPPQNRHKKLLLGVGVFALASVMLFGGNLLWNNSKKDHQISFKGLDTEAVKELQKQQNLIEKSLKNVQRNLVVKKQERTEKLQQAQKFFEGYVNYECEVQSLNKKTIRERTEQQISCIKSLSKTYLEVITSSKDDLKKIQGKPENFKQEMQQAYDKLKQKLPNSQKTLLEKSHKTWQDYQTSICEFHSVVGGNSGRDKCLILTYKDKKNQLNKSLKTYQ